MINLRFTRSFLHFTFGQSKLTNPNCVFGSSIALTKRISHQMADYVDRFNNGDDGQSSSGESKDEDYMFFHQNQEEGKEGRTSTSQASRAKQAQTSANQKKSGKIDETINAGNGTTIQFQPKVSTFNSLYNHRETCLSHQYQINPNTSSNSNSSARRFKTEHLQKLMQSSYYYQDLLSISRIIATEVKVDDANSQASLAELELLLYTHKLYPKNFTKDAILVKELNGRLKAYLHSAGNRSGSEVVYEENNKPNSTPPLNTTFLSLVKRYIQYEFTFRVRRVEVILERKSTLDWNNTIEAEYKAFQRRSDMGYNSPYHKGQQNGSRAVASKQQQLPDQLCKQQQKMLVADAHFSPFNGSTISFSASKPKSKHLVNGYPTIMTNPLRHELEEIHRLASLREAFCSMLVQTYREKKEANTHTHTHTNTSTNNDQQTVQQYQQQMQLDRSLTDLDQTCIYFPSFLKPSSKEYSSLQRQYNAEKLNVQGRQTQRVDQLDNSNSNDYDNDDCGDDDYERKTQQNFQYLIGEYNALFGQLNDIYLKTSTTYGQRDTGQTSVARQHFRKQRQNQPQLDRSVPLRPFIEKYHIMESIAMKLTNLSLSRPIIHFHKHYKNIPSLEKMFYEKYYQKKINILKNLPVRRMDSVEEFHRYLVLLEGILTSIVLPFLQFTQGLSPFLGQVLRLNEEYIDGSGSDTHKDKIKVMENIATTKKLLNYLAIRLMNGKYDVVVNDQLEKYFKVK